MDDIKNESLLLYNICCSIGISSSQRERNIQLIDSAKTLTTMLYDNVFTDTMIFCGSKSEGITPFRLALNKGTHRDVDFMHMIGGINVQEHVDTTNTNQAVVLQLLSTTSQEHVLLEVKSYAYKTFNNNDLCWMPRVIIKKYGKNLVSSSRLKVFVQDSFTAIPFTGPSVPVYNVNDIRYSHFKYIRNFNETTIHGPAVMSESIPNSGIGNFDHVCCLRCYEWPTAAHEWIDRARPHGWPSQDLIDQIMNDGCELVPVGRKDHADGDIEWKLSFSRAETRLIRNFNIYQAQCYQLLKIVKTDFVSSVVADSLSSYHIKTVMLHTVEQTDPKVWRKDNLAQCFMMCLSNLKRYLTDKFLPQYFIVRQNLLEPKLTGDIYQKVLEVVTDLDKIGWKCILQCPPLNDLYWFIQKRVGSFHYTLPTYVHALAGNTELIREYCWMLLEPFFLAYGPVFYNCYLIQIVVFCEKNVLKPTATYPNVESARVHQQLYKGTLGLVLTLIRAMAHPDLRPGIGLLMNFVRQCLEESCHADVSSGRLKLATFFFHLGEYDRCLATVQEVLERFKDVWIVVGGLVNNDDEIKEAGQKMDTSKLQLKLNRILQLYDNGFPFISNHLSLPALFTHWEVAVSPKGVHYVHKETRSPKLLFNKVCVIDSIVYAHYLLVESYLKIDEHDHAELALINMKESIRNRKDDMFDINCLGFYEEDKLLLHYSESLVQVANNVKDKLTPEQEDV